jgi:hypothetical protein
VFQALKLDTVSSVTGQNRERINLGRSHFFTGGYDNLNPPRFWENQVEPNIKSYWHTIWSSEDRQGETIDDDNSAAVTPCVFGVPNVHLLHRHVVKHDLLNLYATPGWSAYLDFKVGFSCLFFK